MYKAVYVMRGWRSWKYWKSWRHWSESEISILSQMYTEGKSAREISEHLDRSLPAVYGKISDLGFAKQKKVWTDTEIQLVKAYLKNTPEKIQIKLQDYWYKQGIREKSYQAILKIIKELD